MKPLVLYFLVAILAGPATAQKDSLTQAIYLEINAGRKSLDSLIAETEHINAAVDSSMKAHNKSMMQEAIRRDSASNARNRDRFLYERKEQERKENRNLIIRSGLIGAITALAVVLYAQKKT